MQKFLNFTTTALILISALICLIFVLPAQMQILTKLNNIFLVDFLLPLLTLLILLSWLLSIITSHQLTISKNNLILPIGFLILSRAASVTLLPNKLVSLFSYDFWIWICFAIVFFVSNNNYNKIKRFAIPLFSLVALVALVSFNTTVGVRAVNKLFKKSLETPVRLDLATSWSVALETLKQYPLQGIGPGLYLNAFNRFRPLFFNDSEHWNVRFNRSVNLPFDILTTTGLLGLAAFGYLVYKFLELFKFLTFGNLPIEALAKTDWKLQAPDQKKFGVRQVGNYIVLAIALLFLITSFFFSLSYPLLWLMFLLFAELKANSSPSTPSLEPSTELSRMSKLETPLGANQLPATSYQPASSSLAAVATVFSIFLVILGSYLLFNGYRAEYFFQKSLTAASQNLGTQTYQLQQEAIRYHPLNDNYRRTFSRINLALANSLSTKKDLSDEERQQIQGLISQAISEAKLVTEQLNPQNSLNWELRGQTYQSLIGVAQNADIWAIHAFQQAIFLEPFNPRLRLDLGGLYLSRNDPKNAAEIFKIAVQVKPGLANAHYNLAVAFKTNNELSLAKQQMEITKRLLEEKGLDNEQDSRVVEEGLKEIEKELREATESAKQATPSTSSQ